ncbi:MAG: hypothetical protein ABIO55_12445 [Ginsengibacter sp.]
MDLADAFITSNFDLAMPIKFTGGIKTSVSFLFLLDKILKLVASAPVNFMDLVVAGSINETGLLTVPLIAEKTKLFLPGNPPICALHIIKAKKIIEAGMIFFK